MSEILLSFCTPVMNRLGDLKATLRKNLDDNLAARDQVEFIVVCFDKDSATEDWVRSTFAQELEQGYLRFYRSAALKGWHFGRAKNAFRDLMRGRIYASLDGDNFTGPGGGRHIIDVFEAQQYNCVLHQFQGDWGDGTCGRVSLNADDYRAIGYDNDFLPRQWDELDAILSVLNRNRGRRYVCYQGKSIMAKSQPFSRYLKEHSLQPTIIELEPASDPLFASIQSSKAAVGQHASSYVQDDPKLRHSSIFNHLTSYYKNTDRADRRNQYVSELVDVQRAMAREIDAGVLLAWYLEPAQAEMPPVGTSDIVLTSCIKNEPDLDRWYAYYKALGVTRFLIVDDGSDVPVRSSLPHADVAVWRPKCGKFRYSKAFWLEVLLRNFGLGTWCLTVDSDEYLSLPGMFARDPRGGGRPSPLGLLVQYAEKQAIGYFCGFLLDLLPAADHLDRLRAFEDLPVETFSNFQFRPRAAVQAYMKQNTIRWSYGEHGEWACSIDARFRLNRALDSLRKFPVLKYSKEMHLNQGFHDLVIARERRTPSELSRADLLPIAHYKLYASQLDAANSQRRPLDAYHHETGSNLERLRKSLNTSLRQAAVSPFTFPYFDYAAVPTPSNDSIQLAVCPDRPSSLATSADDIITRKAPIPVVIRGERAEFDEGVLFAPTFSDAITWVRNRTPYSKLVRRTDTTATFAVGDHE